MCLNAFTLKILSSLTLKASMHCFSELLSCSAMFVRSRFYLAWVVFLILGDRLVLNPKLRLLFPIICKPGNPLPRAPAQLCYCITGLWQVGDHSTESQVLKSLQPVSVITSRPVTVANSLLHRQFLSIYGGRLSVAHLLQSYEKETWAVQHIDFFTLSRQKRKEIVKFIYCILFLESEFVSNQGSKQSFSYFLHSYLLFKVVFYFVILKICLRERKNQ